MLRFPVHRLAPPVVGLPAAAALPSLRARALSSSVFQAEPSCMGLQLPPGLFAKAVVDDAPGVPKPPPLAELEASGDFEQQLQELARQSATSVSLNNLFRSGDNPTPEQSLLNAQFLWRELRIRFAHRAVQLRELPFGIAEHPSIKDAEATYRQITALLLTCPKPRTFADEEAFARILNATKPSSVEIPHKIGVALDELNKRQPFTPEQQRVVDQRLDTFFLMRVGHRFLIQHYLASKQPRPGFSGIIQSQCSPVEVCEAAAARMGDAMRKQYGACPEIHVIGDRAHTFTYVPSHIYFIVAELMKNACAATVRRHAGESTLPPVRAIVARGDEDVTVKVEDQGGGIARSRLADVWSYKGAWMTIGDAEEAPTVGGAAAPLTQHGLGLPLSRLYAKYFGGTLHLTPMEGYGTDCYVKLNRLGDHNCENLPEIVQDSPGEHDSAPRSAAYNSGGWGGNNLVSGASATSRSLFDAQARR